jgi:hypothetical protein
MGDEGDNAMGVALVGVVWKKHLYRA